MKLFKRIIITLLLCLVLAYAGIWYVVRRDTRAFLFTDTSQVPKEQVAMVLGAQVVANERPSTVLAYRLQSAVDLYKAGKVHTLLMSGDGRSPDYDEVAIMQKYAQDNGVAASDILIDASGLHTYDSCFRAKTVFGLHRLVVVSQADHALRAIYICRSLGIDAVGLSASGNTTGLAALREQAALILAWLDVHIVHPTPSNSTI